MGYSLTTSLAPPSARAPASPKTHTPLPRLQERGLRFYSTELSRWVSRDPLEESSGVNLLVFLNNEPVRSFDVLGLASACAGAFETFLQGNEEIRRLLDELANLQRKPSCCLVVYTPLQDKNDCPGKCEGNTTETDAGPCKLFNIGICCDKAQDFNRAIAHELEHVFDRCLNRGIKCDTAPPADLVACKCRSHLCRELRALEYGGQCPRGDFDKCWDKLLDRGYGGELCRGLNRTVLRERLRTDCRFSRDPRPRFPSPSVPGGRSL
jgi:RHS repeat-associated protein